MADTTTNYPLIVPLEPMEPARAAEVAELLVDAVDLHCHSGPAAMPRILGHTEAFQMALDARFKALLYMACGVPPVCSPVGMTTDIVQDGQNGLLATTTDEWIERLSLLVENPDLRRQMGEAGRTTVEEKYSLTTHAPRFLETLQRTAELGRCGVPPLRLQGANVKIDPEGGARVYWNSIRFPHLPHPEVTRCRT